MCNARAHARRLLLAAACLVLSGCAVLTRPAAHALFTRQPSQRSARGAAGVYHDYVGVIHVHTTYSHDAHGRFADVVRVANAQRLDYVILTEHNTLQPLRDGLEGRHGAVLILIGMEISAREGHYLAFGVTEEIDREHLTTQQVIDEVNRQGGFGFIAHPYFQKKRWTNWSVTGYTGLEAYNFAHDTLDENRVRLVLWTLMASNEPFYESIIDRPYDPLAKWDELLRGRPVVGIGSVDAHEFHVFGIKFAPYDDLFRLSRTHVLVPAGKAASGTDAAANVPPSKEAVYEALRGGHVYVALELLTEAKGFRFLAEDHGRVLGIMGDEVHLVPNLRFMVSLPAAAQLTLWRDGRAVDSTVGQTWEIPVAEPGVYRIEASRHQRPWIFSNPIYVRAPPAAPEEPALQVPTEPTATNLPADTGIPAPGSQPSPAIAPR